MPAPSEPMVTCCSFLNPNPVGTPTFDFHILEKYISGNCSFVIGASWSKPQCAQSVPEAPGTALIHLNLWVSELALWILNNYQLKIFIFFSSWWLCKMAWQRFEKNQGSCFSCLENMTSSLVGTELGWTQKILLGEIPLITGNEWNVTCSDRTRPSWCLSNLQVFTTFLAKLSWKFRRRHYNIKSSWHQGKYICIPHDKSWVEAQEYYLHLYILISCN